MPAIQIGECHHQNRTYPVYLKPVQRCSHMHVIGAQGTGKSTFFLKLIRAGMEAGEGLAVFDPHGDLIDDLLKCVPDHRKNDVILFDPSDPTHVIPFNVLSASSEQEATTLVDDLVSLFRRLSNAWGDNMEVILQMSVIAFLKSPRGGSLADLERFLIDDSFRAAFLRTVDDQDVHGYWTNPTTIGVAKKSIGPLTNRLRRFLAQDTIRAIVSQKTNTINFQSVLDTSKIFFARLSSGLIGDDNAKLLGTTLLAKFFQTAMARAGQDRADRTPYYIYVDEVSELATPSLSRIITHTRKYGIGLTIAHQSMAQIKDPELASALELCHTRICCRTNERDAQALSPGFKHFTPADILSLKSEWPHHFESICRVGSSDRDFKLLFAWQAPPLDGDARALEVTRLSRTQYSVPKPDVLTTAPISEPQIEPIRGEAGGGRGGNRHRAIQDLVAGIAKAHGFTAVREKEILRDRYPDKGYGIVDVSVEREDIRIACEISDTTSPRHEIENSVLKALEAGYAFVVCISDHPKKLDAIRSHLEKEAAPSDLAKVKFLSPDDFNGFMAGFAAVTGITPDGTHEGWKIEDNLHEVSEDQLHDYILEALGELAPTPTS